jgi:hypothetical protein
MMILVLWTHQRNSRFANRGSSGCSNLVAAVRRLMDFVHYTIRESVMQSMSPHALVLSECAR